MKESFVLDGVRTPIGSYGGTLAVVRPDDLAALVLKTLWERYPTLAREGVEDVIFGCANQAGEDNRNVARMASLIAGLPQEIPGITVNRLCASGMAAAAHAAQAIAAEHGELFFAGGVESMSRSPWVMAKPDQAFSRSPEVFDTTLGWRFVNPKLKEQYGTHSMGETAENVAERFKISREDQDAFALRSQMKAKAALERKRFEREIVSVLLPAKKGIDTSPVFSIDEFPRPQSTIEALAKLKPAFRTGGSVTAGNSSGINDGACALLIGSADAAKRISAKPRAKIVASAVVGLEPAIMGMGPVGASRRVLERTGLKLEQMDVIEINEAFAAQSVASMRELGMKDDDARVNVNGGAIALGHPLGMSGARLILTAVHELEERKGRYALCTLCIGVGQGMAVVLERVS